MMSARGLVICAICTALAGCDDSNDLAKEAKSAVSKTLKDPDAAKFDDVYVAQDPKGSGRTVCGWVNGKNSFGAYTGKVRFAAVMTKQTDGTYHSIVAIEGQYAYVNGDPIHLPGDEGKGPTKVETISFEYAFWRPTCSDGIRVPAR